MSIVITAFKTALPGRLSNERIALTKPKAGRGRPSSSLLVACPNQPRVLFAMPHKAHRHRAPLYWMDARYAAYFALQQAFAGRFQTVASYAQRIKHAWAFFHEVWGTIRWCHVRPEHVVSYASHLADLVESESLSSKYAKNLISTVNVVTRVLFGHSRHRVEPKNHIGRLTQLRVTPPAAVLNWNLFIKVVSEIRAAGFDEAASVVELAGYAGLRLKEGCLLDCRQALREARQKGKIRIVKGTKGGAGKANERWVPVTPDLLAVLERAVEIQGERNNLATSQQLHIFMRHVEKVALPRLNAQGLGTIHDLRSAYVCRRYEAITGYPAPVVTAGRTAPDTIDARARQTLAPEVGHGRPEIIAAYAGGRKKCRR